MALSCQLLDQSGPGRALVITAQALSVSQPKTDIQTPTLAHMAAVRNVHIGEIIGRSAQHSQRYPRAYDPAQVGGS